MLYFKAHLPFYVDYVGAEPKETNLGFNPHIMKEI